MPNPFEQFAQQQQVSASNNPFEQYQPTAAPAPTTPDTYMQEAAAYIRQIEATRGPTRALAKQAIVDQYRMKAGLEPLLGKDAYQEGLKKRNEDNPFFSFSAGVRQSLAQTGTSLLGTVAPQTAAKLQQDVAATTGPAEGVAGAAGSLLGTAGTMAAVLPAGPAAMAATFGATGFGGTRTEVAQRREAGQDISLGQELGAALGRGALEAGSGFVSGAVANRLGRAFAAAAPGAARVAGKEGGKGLVKYLSGVALPALKGAGVEGAEEAATQLAINVVDRVMGIDPDRGLYEGVVEAGAMGAVLAPFLGGVARKIQADRLAGQTQRQMAVASLSRKTPPPANETKEEAAARLTVEVDEVRGPRDWSVEEAAAFEAADGAVEATTVVETDLSNFTMARAELGTETGDRILAAAHEAITEAVRTETPDRPGDLVSGQMGTTSVRLRQADSEATADTVMTRANEILRAKLENIIGDDLPEAAYPFLSHGSVVRAPGETRSSESLTEEAGGKIEARAQAMARERGVPASRTEQRALIRAHRAKQEGVAKELDPDRVPFSRDRVIAMLRQMSDEDTAVREDLVADEDHVMMEIPVDEIVPSFATTDDVDVDKLDRAEAGIEAGTIAPPVILTEQGGVYVPADGNHRVLAAQAAGLETISALVPQSAVGTDNPGDVVADSSDPPAQSSLDPNPEVQAQAAEYREQAGLPPRAPFVYNKVDTERAAEIARLYEDMEHDPDNPEVQEAYEALKRETLAQWDYLIEQGVVMEPWPEDSAAEQPYADSKEMHADVRENRHLWFFTGGDMPADHPLAEKTGVELGGVELTFNDVFRAVHDWFGHAMEGTGFGPRGEEAAWQEHSQMFSETARRAMTSETRGQNSWVNYGPLGEQNRADPANTTYAQQKAGLLPEWVMRDGLPAGPPPIKGLRYQQGAGLPPTSVPPSHQIPPAPPANPNTPGPGPLGNSLPPGARQNRWNVPSGVEDILTPISYRIRKISQMIYGRLQRLELKTRIRRCQWQLQVAPLLRLKNRLLKGDEAARRRFKQAVLNGEFDIAKGILLRATPAAQQQQEVRDTFRRVRDTLDEIYNALRRAGVDVGYIENFWSREIKNIEDFDRAVRGRARTEIEREVDRIEKKKGRALTAEERTEVANRVINGMTRRQGKFSERVVDVIEDAVLDQYVDEDTSLMGYIDRAATLIERQHFFGRHDITLGLGDTVGAFVDDLIQRGDIDPDDERVLKRTLQARFDTGERGMHSGLRIIRDVGYLSVLANTMSALTQLGDLTLSILHNGWAPTLIASGRKARRIKMTDLGLETLVEDLEDPSRLSAFLNWSMSRSGFKLIDQFGKERFMGAAWIKARRQLQTATGRRAFREKWAPVFGSEYQALEDAVASDVMTENGRLLLFIELSQVQPISLSEMPLGYLAAPNARIFYMLKTFTTKQLQFMRQRWSPMLRQGDIKGFMKDVLAVYLIFGGGQAAIDLLKRLLMGEDITADDLPDAALDSFLKLVGGSKYLMQRGQRDGFGSAFFSMILPPTQAFDDAGKDLLRFEDIVTGEKDWRVYRNIPVIGKILYYRFGEGQEKIQQRDRGHHTRRRNKMREKMIEAIADGDFASASAIARHYNADYRPVAQEDGVNLPRLTVNSAHSSVRRRERKERQED